MTDNANKDLQSELINTENQDKKDMNQNNAQSESNSVNNDNKEEQSNKPTAEINPDENKADFKDHSESQNVEIKQDEKNPKDENTDNIQEYAETQIVDDSEDDKNDLLLMTSSQPIIDDPRGLTGHVKTHKKSRIEPTKLEDIPSWAKYAPKIYKGRKLPKQKNLIFPPNDSINDLISYIPRGDSTILVVDAIVNAANSGLYAGGGICGSIHRAAGPELEEECMKIGGCETGKAVVTPGFELPSKYVIHAVGPIGQHPEELKSAYESTLGFIDGKKVRSVALCCISTGIYGYPIRPATKIALRTVREFLEVEENRKKVDRIIFVVFNQKDCVVYENLLPLYFPLPKGAIEGAEDEEEIAEKENEEEEEEEEEEEIDFPNFMDDDYYEEKEDKNEENKEDKEDKNKENKEDKEDKNEENKEDKEDKNEENKEDKNEENKEEKKEDKTNQSENKNGQNENENEKNE